MSITYRLRRNSALAIAAVCFTIALMGVAEAAGAFAVGVCGAYGYGFDFRKVSDARAAIGGASAISMASAAGSGSSPEIAREPETVSKNVFWPAGGRLCRSNLFMRCCVYRGAAAGRGIASLPCNVGDKYKPRHRVRRMGASRGAAIPIDPAALSNYGRFFRRARLGNSAGHCTIWSSRSASAISLSVPWIRPRTETPASCTVSGSPDISGCHQ